jgi:mannose-6-phosphate isomerase-like protein (cupin superfamily)
MSKRTLFLTALAALLFSWSSNSQTPTRAPSPNPGVAPTRLMDRSDVRVTRVELQVGAVRSVHVHNDVRYHLFIPVSGQLELTIGSAKPVDAAPGQAYYMEKGTPHGFRNVGSTPAMVMEVFVKDGA